MTKSDIKYLLYLEEKGGEQTCCDLTDHLNIVRALEEGKCDIAIFENVIFDIGI